MTSMFRHRDLESLPGSRLVRQASAAVGRVRKSGELIIPRSRTVAGWWYHYREYVSLVSYFHPTTRCKGGLAESTFLWLHIQITGPSWERMTGLMRQFLPRYSIGSFHPRVAQKIQLVISKTLQVSVELWTVVGVPSPGFQVGWLEI